MKKLAILAALLVLTIGGALVLRRTIMKPEPRPPADAIAINGGVSMQVRITTPVLTQGDPRWATDTIGTTGETLQAVGCTVCATAMALAARGFAVTPAALNTKLTGQNGFTESGLLVWGAVRKVAGRKHGIVVDDHPSHTELDAQLARGNPVIAKVRLDSGIWHWVLITGKDGTAYLMHDPLGPGVPHEPMTRYRSGIFTIRHLK